MRLVMIDNYDSFTYNLAQLFYEFDLDVEVYRHDRIGIGGIEARRPDWICISPGPKDPAHAGISKAVIAHFAPSVPILGVCLGMQAINEVFGGATAKAPEPRHGKRSQVFHQGRGILAGIPSPFIVARYHSLQVLMRPHALVPLAHAEDGVLWITLHIHQNIVAVASHKDLAGIILVQGRQPEKDTIAMAEKENIPILVSSLPAFELVGRLYKAGIRGA